MKAGLRRLTKVPTGCNKANFPPQLSCEMRVRVSVCGKTARDKVAFPVLPKNKPLIVLSVLDQDVYIPKHHLMTPLTKLNCLYYVHQLNDLATTTAVCNALNELEKAIIPNSKQGAHKHVTYDFQFTGTALHLMKV